jgi:signal peptide peptidase SppA
MRLAVRAAGVATGVTSVYVYSRRKALPKSPVVLSLDLSSTGSDRACQDAVQAIGMAAKDPAVAGLVGHLGGASMPLVMAQELGTAVKNFREAKGSDSTFAFAPEFNSMSAYTLACKFGYVCQMPGASLRVPGVSMTLPFLGGLLERWGLRLEVFESGPLKNGLSAFSARGPTREQAKNAESLAQSTYAMVVRDIAAERGVSERSVRRLASGSWWTLWLGALGYVSDRSWLTSAEAKRARLVDDALYQDAFEALTAKRCQTEATMPLSAYLQARRGNAHLDAAIESAFGHLLGAALAVDGVVGASDGAYALAPRLCELAGRPAPPKPAAGKLEAAPSPTTIKALAGKGHNAGVAPARGGEPAVEGTMSSVAASALSAASTTAASMGAAATAASGAYSWMCSAFSSNPQPSIGILHLRGPILPCASSRGGGALGRALSPNAAPAIHAEAVRAQLREAREDPSIRAVVLRIDSPGGDAVASDAIRREVQLTREAGKPVVASMGRTCASGGYLIASACDRILAQPATLTGSIGALSGMLDATAFLRKHRVQLSVVSAGPPPLSPARSLTRRQRRELRQLAARTSAEFEAQVAAGRGMSKRSVRCAAAGGRVWTGEQALGIGLVDALGGASDAVALAGARAGLDEGVPIKELSVETPLWATALAGLTSTAGGAMLGASLLGNVAMAAVDDALMPSDASSSSVVVLLAADLPQF